MTLWHPDTCSCQIEFSDDGLLTQGTVRAVCSKHAGVPTANLLATLFAHNQQKNAVQNWLVSKYNIPVTDGGHGALQVGYDPNAAMNNDPVTVKGLTSVAPVAVPVANTALTTQFGPNAVKVIS